MGAVGEEETADPTVSGGGGTFGIGCTCSTGGPVVSPAVLGVGTCSASVEREPGRTASSDVFLSANVRFLIEMTG